MRILYLIASMGTGGAEVQLVNLSKELMRRGHEVKIITLKEFDLNVSPIKGSCVPHSSLGLKGLSSILPVMIRLKKMIDDFSPNVIHSHMFHSNILSRVMRFFVRDVPIVNTAHSTSEGGKPREMLYRITKDMPDFFSHVSEYSLKRYVENGLVNNNKSLCIYNGIAVDDYSAPTIRENEDIFRWVAVGRLIPPKDYENLLLAAKIISMSSGRKITIDIYGSGELRDDIAATIRELGLSQIVRLRGYRRDVISQLDNYDAFVLSSYNEGLPMVLLEAAMMGIPIVTTDAGGAPEALSHDNSIFVCRSRDPFSLAYVMQKMMKMDGIGRKLVADKNFMHVESRFNLQAIAGIWEDKYLEVSGLMKGG